MYVTVSEGCLSSMWLSLGNITEQNQFLGPLTDLFGDILANELIRAKWGSYMWATMSGDVNKGITKKVFGSFQVIFLC